MMKHICLMISIWLSCGLHMAWAEDTSTHTPMVDEYTHIDMYTTTPKKEASITLMPASTIARPQLSRQDNAALHLSLLRDEVDHITKVGFFGAWFDTNEALQQALMRDIALYLHIYSDLPIAAEAMQLKGDMLAKQNNTEAATVAYLQTIYEFPNTPSARQSKKKVLALVAEDWSEEEKTIQHIAKSVPDGNTATRLRLLSSALYPIENKEMVVALTLLQLDILKRFPDDPHIDEVQVLLAHNMGADSAKAGIFGFKKLLALYPNSNYRPEAMLAIADLQRIRLKDYEKAEKNYQTLINSYPEHQLTKHAYVHLADTQANHLKKYTEAVETYATIVQLYPNDTVSLKALQHKANIEAKKLKAYQQAVVSLRQLATMFHSFEATDALKDAIKIAEKKLKDDALAFDIRQQLVRDYPNSDIAPKALFNMAEYKNDTTLYEQFLSQYPDHKLAKKVREKLQSGR